MWTLLLASASVLLASTSDAQTVDCSARPPAPYFMCCPAKPKSVTPAMMMECGAAAMPTMPPMPSSWSDLSNMAAKFAPPRGDMMTCDVVKCLMNKNNLLDGDKVNRQTFVSFMMQEYSSDWSSVIQSAADLCNSQVDASTSDCEPKQYMKCFKSNMLKNCPDSVLTQTTECISARTFMQQCPMPGPMG